MTNGDLWSKLQANIPSGTSTLTFSVPNNLGSADIDNLLTTYFPRKQFSLTYTNTPAPGARITFSGTFQGELFGADNPPAVAVFSLAPDDGPPELTLTVSMQDSGWSFHDSFSSLKGTIVDSLTFDSPQFVLQSYTGGPSSHPLVFSGGLQVDNGPPANVAWLLQASGDLQLSGPVDTSHAFPTMALQTPPTPSLISFGPVHTQMWIDAAASNGSNSPTASVGAGFDVQIGSSASARAVEFAVSLPDGPAGILTFDADVQDLVVSGLDELSTLTGGTALANLIPSSYSLGTQITVTDLEVDVAAALKEVISLEIGLSLSASPLWKLIPTLIEVSQIGLRFILFSPLDPSPDNIETVITTQFLVAGSPINVTLFLPELRLEGVLDPHPPLKVVDAFTKFIGTVPDPGLTIEELGIQADIRSGTYMVSAHTVENWTLPILPNFTLETISVSIVRTPTAITGQISGTVHFVKDFILTAQKPAGPGWIFSGMLAPGETMSVQDLVNAFLPPNYLTLPTDLQSLALTELAGTFNSQSGDYSFSAAISWVLKITENLTFELDASVNLNKTGTGENPYSGAIEGDFSFNNLKLTAIYQFAKGNATYIFKFGDFECDYDSNAKRLTIHFGDATLGSILAFLVDLADPGAKVQLDAPWNVLNDINLKNLLVIVNFGDPESIEIDYALNLDLGFIDIDTLGLIYTRQFGQGQVKFSITGTFFGQKFDSNNPLQWDALHDSPPAVPGKGTQLLDLKYLGLGQHVALTGAEQLDTMQQVIKALLETVMPVDDPTKNPLEQLSGLSFDAGSSWLIGASFVVMDTFGLDIIFNDPQLYGLLITVNGPKAAIFQGLSFEILYHKVTDQIGVYHIELKLPDAMRHLEFGEVSVTLPVVILDIYTNGNFCIDFGFPPSIDDWSNSFAVQVFPFVGYGGFYFALLDGATSTRVPQITNGSFDPVIEFGIALSIGVGKTIDEGVFSAGISVTVTGILEGVIGWFNPDDASTPSDRYYWIEGTVSVLGKLYGTVDFKIIKATVSLTVYAAVTLIVEAYQPIYISLEAGVEVSASVHFLFVTVHFSFKMTVKESFTIGSAQPTPWKVAAPSPSPGQLAAQRSAFSARPVFGALAHPAIGRVLPVRPFRLAARAGASNLAQAPVTVQLLAAPWFSQAMPADLGASGTSYTVACTLLLLVPNGIDQSEEPAFDTLMGKVLAWAIANNPFPQNPDPNVVTAAELQYVLDQLGDESIVETQFAYANLAQFFTDYNVTFDLTARPTSQIGAQSATFFPMIPELTVQDTAGLNRSFITFMQSCTPEYEEKLDLYFQQLMVQFQTGVEQDPDGTSGGGGQLQGDDAGPPPGDATAESMATYLFRGYFTMLARTVVRSAIDMLRAFSYAVTDPANTSLHSIATSFPPGAVQYVVQPGDSLQEIASYFGISVDQILQANPTIHEGDPLNPGQVLTIPLVVTPAAIAVEYVVQQGDSLQEIASHFGISVGQILQANPTIHEGDPLNPGQRLIIPLVVTPAAIATANQATTGILGAVALTIPTVTYQVKNNDSLEGIARSLGVTVDNLVTANQDSETLLRVGATVAAGSATHTVQGGFQFTYPVQPQDTLSSIMAHYFPGVTDPDAQTALAGTLVQWNSCIGPAPDYSLASCTSLTIPYTDTLGNIARCYGVQLSDIEVSTNTENQQLLSPTAVVTATNVPYTPGPNDSLAAIAQKYNVTVADLAGPPNDTLPGIFKQTTITVPNVPAMALYDLQTNLASTGGYNQAAAQVSRFLFHGLRAPSPADPAFANLTVQDLSDPATTAGIDTYPLFALTGQEFVAPTPPSPTQADPTSPYTITLTNPGGASWISFADGSTPTPTQLALPLVDDEWTEISAYSQTKLSPQIGAPMRLPLYTYAPARFSLQHLRHWQAAELPANSCLTGSGQSAGEPTIWPLPARLQDKIAGAQGTALLYDVLVGTYPHGSSGMQTNPVGCGVWGTTVTFQVQQATAGDAASTMQSSYTVLGTDDAGTQTLLSVLTYLANNTADTAELCLLYGPDQSGANSSGYVSDVLDPTQTFLLKTNLSTLSHSGEQMRMAPAAAAPTAAPTPQYSATIADSAQFLKLLWECSIVRSGGYYLNYYNSVTKTGLPDRLFTAGTNATLTLLVILGSQAGGSAALQPFNNCVVVGDNIDASSSNVFVQPRVHAVQPGVAIDYTVGAGGTDTVASIAGKYGVDPTRVFVQSTMLPASDPLSQGEGLAILPVAETLATITSEANISGVGVPQLAEFNQVIMNLLRPGASLQVGAQTYTVVEGDTFESIAAAKGTDVATLASANANLDVLEPGAVVQFASGQLQLQSLAPPGTIGFQLDRMNPDPGSQSTSLTTEQELNLLFNLLGFSIAGGTSFSASGQGLPAGPTITTPTSANGLSPTAGQDDTLWHYRQLLSLAAFGKVNDAFASPALPDPTANPYAGIQEGASVTLQFALQDVFGNVTQPSPAVPNLTIPNVGYTDDLIALPRWPAAIFGYEFAQASVGAELCVDPELQISKYLPTADTPYSVAIKRARADCETYAGIYYQLVESDVTCNLATSVGTVAESAAGLWRQQLLDFVSSTYMYLTVAQQLQAVYPAIAAGTKLGDLASTYPVSATDIVTANKDVPAGELFPDNTTLNIPTYCAFPSGSTISAIVQNSKGTITAQQLAENNPDVPLAAGVVVSTNPRSLKVDGSKRYTLLQLSASAFMSVADLANASVGTQRNADQALNSTLTLQLDGLSCPVSSGDTLNTMVMKFKALNPQLQIGPADVAVANQLLPGFFADGAQLVLPTYITQPGDTLASLAANYGPSSPADLLNLNLAVSGLYPAATPLYLGASASTQYAVQSDDTFASIAQQFFLTLDALAANNLPAAFTATNQLQIPFLLDNNAGSGGQPVGYAPYVATGSEKLLDITTTCNCGMDDLLTLNHDRTGMFNTSQPIQIGSHEVTPATADSFDTLAPDFGLQPAAFADAVKETAGVLRGGALVILPALVAGSSDTLGGIAGRYHLAIGDLAEANACLRDLLQPGQKVSYTDSGGKGYPPQTTTANDSLATVVSRFAAPDLTAAILAGQNPTLALIQGARLVPPPIEPSLAASVSAAYPSAIFPVTVTLTLQRRQDHVDQDFQSAPAVLSTQTQVVAKPLADQQAGDSAQPLSLQTFASQFEAAFPGLKMATGDGTANGDGGARRLWAVNFAGPAKQGVQYQTTSPICFFALKPLATTLLDAANVPVYNSLADFSSNTPTNKNFSSVNLDDWMQTLLGAVDLVLSPGYAIPIYGLPDGSYEQIVAAKGMLAQSIAGRVDYLLGSSAGPNDPYVSDAQTALLEQATVQLLSAYQTDVLVQQPFTIAAAQQSWTTPARLSGKPVASFLSTAAGDDLDSLALRFGVSAPYLAVVMQDLQHILNAPPPPAAPIHVQYAGKTGQYAIGPQDTLQTIAAFFNVDVEQLPENLTVVESGEGLFQSSLALNISRIVQQCPPGGTLSAMAGYAGVTVQDLVLANQDVPDVFVPSSTVTLGGKDYTVQKGDKLSDVAQALEGVSPTTLSTFATALWEADLQPSTGAAPYTLNSATSLTILQLTPDFNFTTAKVPLQTGTTPATFLLTVKDAPAHKMLALDLDYVVNQVEHDISAPIIDGYQESSWLSFIIPIDDETAGFQNNSGNMGQLRIPIPLRAYPSPPILSNQTAQTDTSMSGTTVPGWKYCFQVARDMAAQDSLYLDVGFNVLNIQDFNEPSSSSDPQLPLLTALAQFITVYPEIQSDLSPLLESSSAPQAANAIKAFATLVTSVANAWAAQTLMEAPTSVPAAEVRKYRMDAIASEANPDEYSYLLLTQTDGLGNSLWPQISQVSSGGSTTPVPAQGEAGKEALYKFSSDVPSALSLQLLFDELDIIFRQNAWSGAYVTRNESLLSQDDTNSDFVYRTPFRVFPTMLTPLVQSPGPTALPAGSDVEQALSTFFQQLFDVGNLVWTSQSTMTIKIAATYAFPLLTPASATVGAPADGGDQSMWVSVPLIFHAQYDFIIQSDWQVGTGSFVHDLATQVETTAQNVGAPQHGGRYSFDLTVFSTLQGLQNMPILEMDNLYFERP